MMQTDDDPTASERKRDHIEMAFLSQVDKSELDRRFYYEPLLAAHPPQESAKRFLFLGKSMRHPLWVSSMTGGTEWAKTINYNLARACKDFGLGMGLGSCRSLLYSNDTLADFDVRHVIGEELPLYANLGVAQVEQLLETGELRRIRELIKKLQADGLIIHVNPLQEWLQPEGDKIVKPPLQTIATLLEKLPIPVIVKEVGQGMGYRSLEALFQLPLAAIDFGAHGGTNFAKLEMMRGTDMKKEVYGRLATVGHSAEEMTDMCNRLTEEMGDKMRCRQIIISGGVRHFLDGYYLTQKCKLPSVYGQASGFLRHARGAYEALHAYVDAQIQGLELARAYLTVK